jgi:hypothetical protein
MFAALRGVWNDFNFMEQSGQIFSKGKVSYAGIKTPSDFVNVLKCSWMSLVIGRSPFPTRRPSISTTGVSSPIVPVVKTSSAVWNSTKEILRSITGPRLEICRTRSITICRVMPRGTKDISSEAKTKEPGRQESGEGVATTPLLIIKMFVAFVSETNPSMSSIRASATPEWLA